MILLGSIFSILAVLSQATPDGHCVMRGNCITDDVTSLSKPCVYEGNPLSLKDRDAINVLNELCPNLRAGPNFPVCCDASQIKELNSQLAALASLFKRCPSCFHNLANLFCQLVCSPDQSSFLQVTASEKNSVDEMSFYITDKFATGLFDSCKNVKLSFTSSSAIGIACGSHWADCTPYLWLEYMGTRDPSPYQINFHFENSTNVIVGNSIFYPMNERIIPCSQAVNADGAACSWVDCPEKLSREE